VIANSSDPIGGVELWSTKIDTSGNNLRGIGLALSVDNSTGLLFVSYSLRDTRGNTAYACMQAMAPVGKVGFSSLWTQRVETPPNSPQYCNSANYCTLTPVLCGSQVLLTTPTAIVAFDQTSGLLLWRFGGSFGNNYHQPVCHPGGMFVVVNGTTSVIAFQANTTSISPYEMWRQSTGAFQVLRAPVIDAMGNVYVIGGASSSSDPNGAKLFAFDYRQRCDLSFDQCAFKQSNQPKL